MTKFCYSFNLINFPNVYSPISGEIIVESNILLGNRNQYRVHIMKYQNLHCKNIKC